MLPGIKLNTTPTRYTPISQEQLMQFDGAKWVPLGDLIDAERVKRSHFNPMAAFPETPRLKNPP